MASVGSYVETYAQQLAVVLAEEDYTQQASSPASNAGPPGAPLFPREREIRRRRIHSEFALLRLPTDETTWTGVREVLEVDGRTVSDHAGRLMALLKQPFRRPSTSGERCNRRALGSTSATSGEISTCRRSHWYSCDPTASIASCSTHVSATERTS
jgi:hypothetical protein